jgi:hypothetical protein
MYKVFDMYNTDAAYGNNPPRDWSADLHALFAAERKSAEAARATRVASQTPVKGARPSLPLERYVGAYTDSTYGTVTVTLANRALHARFVNVDMGNLEPVQYDSFRSSQLGREKQLTPVTFLPDGAGKVTGVRVFGVTFTRSDVQPQR